MHGHDYPLDAPRGDRPGEPCKACGNPTEGIIEYKGGQHMLMCKPCGAYTNYNVPKKLLGLTTRSLKPKRETIDGETRRRVFDRDLNQCACCGLAPPAVDHLQIGHVLSVHDARAIESEFGFHVGDELLNHEENLIAQCDVCNSNLGGQAKHSLHARFFLALLIRRYAPSGAVPVTPGPYTIEFDLCSKCKKPIPRTGTYDCGECGAR